MIRQNLRYSMLLTLAICTLVSVASTAQARTWRVARNGSGDFMIVAEAVEAAASGDTISIAPGDYPEVVEYQTPSRAVEMIGYVLQGELTIIGDDRESVILGTPTQAPNIELGPTGIVVAEGCTLQLRGVTIRNSGRGIDCNGSGLDVRDCRFVGGDQGVTYVGEGFTTVVDCVFENNADAGVMVFEVRGATGALVENCTFLGNGLGIDFQPANCIVRNSSFAGKDGRGSVGVQVSFGGSALIERCTFTEIRNVGVGAVGGSQAHLYDCVFEPTIPTNVFAEGLLVGSGNHLGGGTYATLEFTKSSTIDFHGNHILNAGGYSVRAFSGPEPVKHFDLSGNYWGTTSTTQLDEWIYDHNDRPTVWFAVVDYLPLADQPIPTDESSIGRLKVRYSGH